MSTILDSGNPQEQSEKDDWRASAAKLNADVIFRSATEANFAPLFEKLESAMKSEEQLESMLAKCVGRRKIN